MKNLRTFWVGKWELKLGFWHWKLDFVSPDYLVVVLTILSLLCHFTSITALTIEPRSKS